MQVVDQQVSRMKFDRELRKFYTANGMQRKRGVILHHAEFPNIILHFVSPKLTPIPIVFAVRINFENYDLDPLSVRFIHPLTWENLEQVSTPLPRKILQPNGVNSIQNLVQKDITGLPFLCMPGIREYHDHPAHTGDFWLLHRRRGGEGSFGFIVDKLYEYGISGINAYNFQLVLQGQTQQATMSYDINQIAL